MSASDRVAIVDTHRAPREGPLAFGKHELLTTLEDREIGFEEIPHWSCGGDQLCLVIGTTADRKVRRLLTMEGVDVRSEPEGVVSQWCKVGNNQTLLLAGTDECGAMYALLEVADAVRVQGVTALKAVDNRLEFPENRVRGIDRFVSGPVHDDWFYDEEFWRYYLDRLAHCRFNRLVVVTGYDTSFMSPPYPFVVDVPGFDVAVTEDVEMGRDGHRDLLRMVGRLCRERGIEFYLGIWQQMPWEMNPYMELSDRLTTKYADEVFEDPETIFQPMIDKLPDDAESFTEYCAEGLRRLLVGCPEIDGIQLRVNYESGFGDRSTAEEFWCELIDAVKQASIERECDPRLDLRAKGLTDEMIEHALQTGLDITVATKYWCESTGLPHHLTQMRSTELSNLDDLNHARRYSYADLLREPRSFDILYRLWVMGTNRIFLWGDPDYARRFSHSMGFGNAHGFEVTAPLTLKGGHSSIQTEPWPLFDDESLSDYEWEDERYWAWYLFFGRLGYSTGTNPDVWEREFRRRFGEAADPIQHGYRAASKVLPLLTAAHLARHPGTVNWAELDTGGALFAEHNANKAFEGVTYGSAEPSDPGLFYGIDEYVEDKAAGNRQPKYTPLQIRDWYRELVADIRSAVKEAEERAGNGVTTSGEYRATRLDLLMLADLAEYHAEKTDASLALSYYQQVDGPIYLQMAWSAADRARTSWASLAERGDGTYHDDLVFVRGPATADSGQWKDRLGELDEDLKHLNALLNERSIGTNKKREIPTELKRSRRPSFTPPSFVLDVPNTVRTDNDIIVSVETGELNDHGPLTLHYRHTDQTEGPFHQVEMERTDSGYRGIVPADYVVPEWDLQVYVSTVDGAGDTLLVPGLYHGKYPQPYLVIKVVAGGM